MVYREIKLNDNDVMYFKFNQEKEQLDNGIGSFFKPYICFNLGVKIERKAWTGTDSTYQGEDGFVMFGTEFSGFLETLKSLVENYKEDEIVITDFEQDTDAEVHIKCEKKRVLVFGHFGQDYNWAENSDDNIESPVLKFKTETTSEVLLRLYDIFTEISHN